MNFEEMIENFTDNHPVWTWILARLIICECFLVATITVAFAFWAIASPFIKLKDGAGLEAFGPWLWLPVCGTFIWLMCSVIGYLWQEFIE